MDVFLEISNQKDADIGNKLMAAGAGLYYFEQYWLMYPSYHQYLYIRKNGDEECPNYGHSSGYGDYNSPPIEQ